ncbi:MAG: VCBS repeat-containing protein [Planctomycetes bacterium]|nr:VCBS repeat-containing protein [Planctomycetota bacterium]
MNQLQFKHSIVDAAPPGIRNDICVVGDLTGNGLDDFVIGGYEGAGNVVWYRAPHWQRFQIGEGNLEAGGLLVDITGDGTLDLVAGQPLRGNELYWWEHPADPAKPWTRRTILDRFAKYHDQAAGDVDSDGKDEIVFLSQQAEVLGYCDIPADPRAEPWPEDCVHIIFEGENIEGLAVADVDSDGENEIVAGGNVFHADGGKWRREAFSDFEKPVAAVGDLTGNGLPDIVLSEGENDRGRLAWFEAPHWKMHLLADDLWHPHSLALADFDGNGRLDIMVAEMGLSKKADFRLIICRNTGSGFETEVVDNTHPTHHARVIRLANVPLPSVVGKSFNPTNQVDLWTNVTTA